MIPLAAAERYGHIKPSKASDDTQVIEAQLRNQASPAAKGIRAVAAQSDGGTTAPLPSAEDCDHSYPCFSTWLFSLETVVPLINLRQAEYWTVEARELEWKIVRWLLGFSSILGWVLVTVTASTVLAARR